MFDMVEREDRAWIDMTKQSLGGEFDRFLMAQKDAEGKPYATPQDAYRAAARTLPFRSIEVDGEFILTDELMPLSALAKNTQLYAELLAENHGMSISDAKEIVRDGVMEGIFTPRRQTLESLLHPSPVSSQSERGFTGISLLGPSEPPPAFQQGGQFSPVAPPLPKNWRHMGFES